MKHFLFNTSYLGRKNTIVVRIGGINRIDLSSLILNFVDIQGNILQAIALKDKLDSDDARNPTIIPPAVPFKMKLTGIEHIFSQKNR